MQGCNKELNFLAEEQNKIKKQDWSDHMLDPPDVRRQYEVRINAFLSQMKNRIERLTNHEVWPVQCDRSCFGSVPGWIHT